MVSGIRERGRPHRAEGRDARRAVNRGHTGLASVSGYTKITERRRGEARRALEEGGL